MQDFPEFVNKVIKYALKLKEEQVICLTGEIQNLTEDSLVELPLLEELAVQIRKHKAFPIIDITTANLKKRFFEEMPPEILQQTPNYMEKLINLTDSFVEISWKSIASGFPTMPKVLDTSFKNISNNMLKKTMNKGNKFIFLNYPDLQLAKYLNINFKKMSSIYFNAVNIDYDELYNFGKEYQRKIRNFSNYQLITADNTLNFAIDNTKIQLNTARDNQIIIYPSGNLQAEIIPVSLEGTFAAEEVYYKNLRFKDVKLNFSGGKFNYISFTKESDSNFLLETEMKNQQDRCIMILGLNSGINEFCDYYLYDCHCEGNLSLKFFDKNWQPIIFSNINVKIKNKKD
ncbi:MAG: hypothetical protein SVM86_03745 [Candidatus Cloacimonadota bacterium]|nr:hypothetical protein [Candidatus Cloacimonadota bacterium]